MMEAESTSETSVNFYQTTRPNIPEDSHLEVGRGYHSQEDTTCHCDYKTVCQIHYILSMALADTALKICKHGQSKKS
jgi:hypothetical protein